MKSLKYLAAAAAFFGLTLAGTAGYAQVACVATSNYSTTTSPGAIVPGTSNVGIVCDDCTVPVTVPFPVRIYNGATTTTVNVESNGTLQFVSATADFTNGCLPDVGYDMTIFAHWDDLRTDIDPLSGVFTSISGVAPNRIFNVEWRTTYFGAAGNANFEVRLHEADAQFEVITGVVDGGGLSATVGVQRDTGSMFTQFQCNTGNANNQQIAFTCQLVPVELLGISVE